MAETLRAALENDLAEKREQHLRRAAAAGPAHGNKPDAQDERRAEHIASPSRYSCQGRATLVSFRSRSAARKWPLYRPQVGDAEGGEEERKRVEDEGHLITEASPPSCRRSNAPTASVIQPVVWVSELAVCSSSSVAMAGRMAERPLVKNGDASISSALST